MTRDEVIEIARESFMYSSEGEGFFAFSFAELTRAFEAVAAHERGKFIPNGWKLAPIELTAEMHEAAYLAAKEDPSCSTEKSRKIMAFDYERGYTKLLAAVPIKESQQKGGT